MTRTWDSAQVPNHPASGIDPREEDPWMADNSENPQAQDLPGDCHLADSPEDHQADDNLGDPQTETSESDHREGTSLRAP